MPTAKDEVRKILDALPDDATLEDVQDSIYIRERVERGRREADEAKLIEQADVETRMERWLASSLDILGLARLGKRSRLYRC